MSLTIQLSGAVEERVRADAELRELSPELVAEHSIRQQYGLEPLLPLADWSEDALLRRLAQGLPAKVWSECRRLSAMRRAGKLGDEDQSRLIQLSDQIEEWSVRRLELLMELARRRRQSVREVMESLGILPNPVA